MHYVGVDLAWGDKNPTGIAVLDDTGHLLHVEAVTTDDQILAALEPYTHDACLVAIDAPLIVKNATGNRACEADLNKDFARFDAGAHPSNTGNADFRDEPRGARIAQRLGLDMNPRSGRLRRAIEVYPHPATVALFRLGRTLKYKDKPGRDLERLRDQLLALIRLLESLTVADPPLLLDDAAGSWHALRTAVERAGRKSELRTVEHQVDAVVCAYVALYASRRPGEVTIYGDLEHGYILSPSLPEDLEPSPRLQRTEPASPDLGAVIRDYAEAHGDLQRITDGYAALVTEILDDAGINYLTVSSRAKSVASFAAKAARTAGGHLVYTDPLREITDQIGLRVITYVDADVQNVVDLLADQVTVHDDRDWGRETAAAGRFGYASRHLLISIGPDSDIVAPDSSLRGRQAQVQIRTVLQHAWAEFEHDIRYKGAIPAEHVSEFDRRFALAAGLLELADREFSTIRDKLREGVAETEPDDEPFEDDPRISPRELAAFLAGQYVDAGWSRTDRYGWIADLVLELGITSLLELGEVLRSVDDAEIAARMDYRYPPGAVRRLDDALLWARGQQYVDLRGNLHRTDLLRNRLARMRSA